VARQAALTARLNAAEQEIEQLTVPDPATFKAVIPLNSTHEKLLAVHGAVLRDRGLPALVAWKRHRYDALSFLAAPDKAPDEMPALSVDMMGHEHRADAFLLTNASEAPVTATVRIEGLPGAPRPAWLRLAATPWTDTAQNVPVAAALPDAEYSNGAFRVVLQAGLTHKVWLNVDSATLPVGRYTGAVVVEAARHTLRVPVAIRVSAVRMKRPRLSLGMWDYTDGPGAYGLTEKNIPAAIKLMRSHFVDTPWAQRRSLPWPGAQDFDADGQLQRPLSFDAFDAWVRRWPGARRYFVFASVPDSFADVKMGTPEFTARISAWAKALAQHMRELGLRPQQLGLLLVDEPHREEQDAIIAAWAKAIKSAAPEITLFQDPTWERPDQTKIQEAITLPDIVCPNLAIFYRGGAPVAQYFVARGAAGQQLWFYQCSGPVRLYDPGRYYRLQAWHAFRHGAAGQGFWAFGDTGGVPSSWNEYLTTHTSYAPAFIGEADATDSISWQAVREGVEDYEYLAMLRDAAATANAEFKTRAEKLLAEAPAAVIGEYSPDYDWQQPFDHQAADTYRLKILALLEQMQ
ncbi:MAG: hypothetical protein M3347_02180, partial [Armatimonadota bacterium]|nr:hypothetical protein [Armatimonadota bacterium]